MKTTFCFLLTATLLLGVMLSGNAQAQTTQFKPTIFALEKQGRSYDSRSTSSHRPWRLAFGLNGNYSFPFDDLYQTIDDGLGYEGYILMAMRPNVSIRFSAGQSGIGLTDQDERGVTMGSDYITPPWPQYMRQVILSEELTTTRYFLSMQFNSSLSRMVNERSMNFIYGGLGLVKQSYRQLSYTINDSTGLSYSSAYNNSEYDFAFTLGAGTTFLLSPNWGLDFQISSDLIFRPNYDIMMPGSPSINFPKPSSVAEGNDPEPRYYSPYYHYFDYEGTLDVKLGLVYFLR